MTLKFFGQEFKKGKDHTYNSFVSNSEYAIECFIQENEKASYGGKYTGEVIHSLLNESVELPCIGVYEKENSPESFEELIAMLEKRTKEEILTSLVKLEENIQSLREFLNKE